MRLVNSAAFADGRCRVTTHNASAENAFIAGLPEADAKRYRRFRCASPDRVIEPAGEGVGMVSQVDSRRLTGSRHWRCVTVLLAALGVMVTALTGVAGAAAGAAAPGAGVDLGGGGGWVGGGRGLLA